MKYFWPLVLIGGTLVILGAVLPSFRVSGGWPSLEQPSSWYDTGIQLPHAGILWAVGGGVLVLVAVFERGKPGSRGVVLIVSTACAFLMVTAEPVLPGGLSYSPAFGLRVSVLGAALSCIGGLRWLSDDTARTRTAITVLLVLELLIVGAGTALAAHPAAGNWLGFWHTDLPKQACQRVLCSVDQPIADCSLRTSCYATATAKAIELTPPAWWP